MRTDIKDITIGGHAVKRIALDGGTVWEKAAAEPVYEYEGVEWIRSSGTQWIDTGIVPDDTTGIEVTCRECATGDVIVMGEAGAASNSIIAVNFYACTAVYLSWNTPAAFISAKGDALCRVNWLNDRRRTVNGTATTAITQPLAGIGQHFSICVFAAKWRKETPSLHATVTVMSARVSQGSELVRDLHPARRIADGALGLYDTVRGEFLTNRGSGVFTAGANTGINY